MKCPYCQENRDRVIDSRESRQGDAVRRRRECEACGKRFTTYERFEEIPATVVKKDGRREVFDRAKLLGGLLKACEKRPVSRPDLERIADEIAARAQETADRELASQEIGRVVMERLKGLDEVAYVRFASVYRQFEDVREFLDELKELIGPARSTREER